MLTGNYALHLALFSKDPHVAIQIFFNENEMKFKIQFLSHVQVFNSCYYIAWCRHRVFSSKQDVLLLIPSLYDAKFTMSSSQS